MLAARPVAASTAVKGMAVKDKAGVGVGAYYAVCSAGYGGGASSLCSADGSPEGSAAYNTSQTLNTYMLKMLENWFIMFCI